MLVDGLEFGQDDEEEVTRKEQDGESEAEDKSDRLAVLMDDTQELETGVVLPGDYHEDVRDDEEITMGSAFSTSGLQNTVTPSQPPITGGLSELFEKKPKSNDLFQYVFASVAGKKG